MAEVGNNIQPTIEQLKELVGKYVNCDEESAKLNDKRAEIRGKVKDLGLDTKAFQDAIGRLKKDRTKKDGYDDTIKVMNQALGDMGEGDLFAWMDVREAAREKERADKKAAREAEAKKADEFKPATERKPKAASTKTAGQVMAEAHPVIQ